MGFASWKKALVVVLKSQQNDTEVINSTASGIINSSYYPKTREVDMDRFKAWTYAEQMHRALFFAQCFKWFTYSVAPLIVFLNCCVILASLTKSVKGNFKYLIVVICLHNLASICGYVTQRILQYWSVYGAVLSVATVCSDAMPIGASLHQLQLTSTKVFAVYAPLDFEATFTKERYIKLGGVSFWIPYALVSVGYLVFSRSMFVDNQQALATIPVDLLNIIGNFGIFLKLKSVMKSSADVEMIQAILSNFLQLVIPLFVIFPGQILVISSSPFGGFVYEIGNICNCFVDPCTIFMCINSYKEALRSLPFCVKSFLKLIGFFWVVFTLICFVLLAIILIGYQYDYDIDSYFTP